MKLAVASGDGPATEAQRVWLRALFAVQRAPKGSPQEQRATLAERNAWAAVQREKQDATRIPSR